MKFKHVRFTTSADNTRIAYSSMGKGSPLVRASHWLSSLDFDWQTPVWGPWNEQLSSRSELFQYDSRGCGLSDHDIGDFTLDDVVADLESVVDAAGLDKFALLGISQGGAIAAAYAARHPERVSHLVLYGAFAKGAAVRAKTKQDIDALESMFKLVEYGWGQENPAFLQMFTTQFFPTATPAQAHAFNEIQKRSTSPEIAALLLRAYSKIDASSYLPLVTAPTLVFHSRGDCRIPFEEGRYMAKNIKNALFEAIDSYCHTPLQGDPAFGPVLDTLNNFIRPVSTAEDIFNLSKRERQVLELIATGLNNSQIATSLSIAPKTVRNHITAIFDKIDVESRAQAIVLAKNAGMGIGVGKN